jgi:hypothetical protein
MTIARLTFVYDADGSLAGELKYWFGTLFGAEHCSLCDLTHSRWGRRSEFLECAERVGVPIEYRHRDDVDPDLAAVVPAWPAVIGHEPDGTPHLLLGRELLADLHGDIAAFESALRSALDHRSS